MMKMKVNQENGQDQEMTRLSENGQDQEMTRLREKDPNPETMMMMMNPKVQENGQGQETTRPRESDLDLETMTWTPRVQMMMICQPAEKDQSRVTPRHQEVKTMVP